MIRQQISRVKVVLGRNAPGRSFTIFEDDAFITSYPRSGNTWTRFLVANLMEVIHI